MDLLTRSEELILLAVWNLQDEAYGTAIRDHLSQISGQDWSFGAVYVPLERLSGKGYVTSTKGESTPKRGGRRKRYFRLTQQGVVALNNIRSIQDALWQGLPTMALRGGEGG